MSNPSNCEIRTNVQFSGYNPDSKSRAEAQRSGFKRRATSNDTGEISCKHDMERCVMRQGAYAPLAQLVEQLTLNQWVPGSSP